MTRRPLAWLRCLGVLVGALAAMAPGSPMTPEDAQILADGVAVAQAGDPAQGRACAEQLEQLAQRLGDRHERAAEALEYAARCHEAAGQYDAMVATRERLVATFPTLPAARVALLALVRHLRATLSFERAAAAMERFAERYPDAAEASELLQEAGILRAQLGQDPRALALFDKVEKYYATKDPQRSAIVHWARVDLLPKTLPDDQARQKHALEYLQRHGSKGGPARRIVAEVTVAAIEWRRACKQKGGPIDLCLTSKPAAIDAPQRGKPPTVTCAGPAAQVVTVYPRDRQLAESAQRRLRQVLELGQALPPVEDPWLQMKVQEALDQADLIVADRELEAALAVRPPTDLNFRVEDYLQYSAKASDRKKYAEQKRKSEDSQRRFLDYWTKIREQSNDVTRRYEKIAARKASPRGAFAAAARVAVLVQAQVDTLLAAEVPDGLGSEEAIKAYCGALRDYTTPVEAAATQALEFCWERAAAFAYTDPSVEFCGSELQRRAPREYPPQRELFGWTAPPPIEPVSAPVQVEPPLSEE
ncbi:hypothetical protein SAMN02745121_07954 [Nannocystis exedens]|uniref:Tetratricopeptide repeat-containing protein n=1 Tax=Nannocystis exedens TaxID=54 RepID=A0A1I2HJ27_9BACT|nr:tetratricopeptide repeat protein [Nannocystis exedens]PCC70379.1 tetratricopeptide repeat protein [Nannocystis exedens]SFF28766.1 hypothetical protein SAMN02745121_07954 [Nannocystis exedens]